MEAEVPASFKLKSQDEIDGLREAAKWLRRGTSHFVKVELVPMYPEPVKVVTMTRYLGVARDLKISVTPKEVTIGLEDRELLKLGGLGVPMCYLAIPQPFEFNKLGPINQDPVKQRNLEFSAALTEETLGKFADDLEKVPGLHTLIRL